MKTPGSDGRQKHRDRFCLTYGIAYANDMVTITATKSRIRFLSPHRSVGGRTHSDHAGKRRTADSSSRKMIGMPGKKRSFCSPSREGGSPSEKGLRRPSQSAKRSCAGELAVGLHFASLEGRQEACGIGPAKKGPANSRYSSNKPCQRPSRILENLRRRPCRAADQEPAPTYPAPNCTRRGSREIIARRKHQRIVDSL